MRESEYEGAGRSRRRRFDDDEPHHLKHLPRSAPEPTDDDAPQVGDRWSTWDLSTAGERGPRPHPDWVVTELAAVDTELGIIKTGKEADAGYLEGRRVRESRTNRAMAKRTGFGREAIAGQWAAAEFAALYRLWEVGIQLGVQVVPYPVQILGTELLLEFLGSEDGEAAPRLAQLRPDPAELADLWRQTVDALTVLARCQIAHGDLSAYNVLVHEGRLVLIDLPQVVDVVANPHGARLLHRDVRNVGTWFAGRGLAGVDVDELTRDLMREAGIR